MNYRNNRTITITRDVDGEFRVPAPDGREAGAYYTDDLEDARATAAFMYDREYGAGWSERLMILRHRRVQQHPEGK